MVPSPIKFIFDDKLADDKGKCKLFYFLKPMKFQIVMVSCCNQVQAAKPPISQGILIKNIVQRWKRLLRLTFSLLEVASRVKVITDDRVLLGLICIPNATCARY